MNSLNQRDKVVYIGSFDEKSPFVYISVFLFDETLKTRSWHMGYFLLEKQFRKKQRKKKDKKQKTKTKTKNHPHPKKKTQKKNQSQHITMWGRHG